MVGLALTMFLRQNNHNYVSFQWGVGRFLGPFGQIYAYGYWHNE